MQTIVEDRAGGDPRSSRGTELEVNTYRSPDASLIHAGKFVIRRVAPDARKLDLADVAEKGVAWPCCEQWLQTLLPSTGQPLRRRCWVGISSSCRKIGSPKPQRWPKPSCVPTMRPGAGADGRSVHVADLAQTR